MKKYGIGLSVLFSIFLSASMAMGANVKTVAGGGLQPIDPGLIGLKLQGTGISLGGGWGTRITPQGTIYFGQHDMAFGPRIFRLTPFGVLDAVTPELNDYPDDLWVDADGGIYYSQPKALYRLMPDNTPVLVAGSPDDALRLDGSLCPPLADGSCAAAGDNGPAKDARFDDLQGFALDRDGNIFIYDSHASVVRRIDRLTQKITRVAGMYYQIGAPSYGQSATRSPINGDKLAVDSVGNLLVINRYDPASLAIVGADNIIRKLGVNVTKATAVDADAFGNVYVVTRRNPKDTTDSGNVFRFKVENPAYSEIVAGDNGALADGTCVTSDSGVATSARLCGVGGISVDKDGQLHVINYMDSEPSVNNRIQRIAFDPVVDSFAPVSGSRVAAVTVTLKGRYFNSRAGKIQMKTSTGAYITVPNVAWSNTEAKFQVPAGTARGTYNFYVTSSDGLVTKSAATYSVNN